MTKRLDPYQRLHGPYKAPAPRRGDRATCLFRDRDVIATGWSDGRIPWPCCRRLDTHGDGSGLLVDEELAETGTGKRGNGDSGRKRGQREETGTA